MHTGKSGAYRLLRLCCRHQLTRRPHSRRASPSIIDSNSEIIYYDLETTGISPSNKHKGIEILQLGAISDSLGIKFQQYILPTKPISFGATQVHGLSLKKDEGSGELDMNSLYIREDGISRRVEAVDKETGLKRFAEWIGEFEAGVTLAGYNNHNYDDWVLCHQMQGLLGGPDMGIRGLADVSKIVRPVLREKLRTRKWNLGFAVTNLLNRSQRAAHGALSDAEDVRDLLIEIAAMRNKTTKNVLNESDEAFRDFEGIWTICCNMEQEAKAKEKQLRKEFTTILNEFISGSEEEHCFPSSLDAFERKLVHEIAKNLSLWHESCGDKEERFICIKKPKG